MTYVLYGLVRKGAGASLLVRLQQKVRKTYQHQQQSTLSPNSDSDSPILDAWDKWMDSDSDLLVNVSKM